MPNKSTYLHLRLAALIPVYDIPKDATFIITKKLKALLCTPVKSFTKDGKCFNQITSSTKSRKREYYSSQTSFKKLCYIYVQHTVAENLGTQIHLPRVLNRKSLTGLFVVLTVGVVVSFNLLKTKRRLLYLKTQSVPCSKHFPPRL